MSRYHVNKHGKPGLCRAKKSCPFGGESEHYATREAAQIVAESRGMKEILNTPSSRRTAIKTSSAQGTDQPNKFTIKGKEFNVNRAKFLSDTRATVGKFLAMRAQLGDLTENKKRMSAAFKRLNKIADHAMVRDDEYLMKKLEHTVLADSSFFKDKNGDRVHVDAALQKAADYKVWQDNREQFENELKTISQDTSIKPGSYKFDGLTVKVEDGQINENYAKELDEKTIAEISETKQVLNVNKIKATMPDHIQSQVIRFEDVAHVVDGRAEKRETLPRITPIKEGGNAMSRFEENAKIYGKFVKQAQENVGSKTAIKNDRDEITKYAKEEAQKINQKNIEEYQNNPKKYAYSTEEKTRSGAKNVLFGGRHHDSGIIVSARDKVDQNAAREIMTQEQIDACTDKVKVINKDKAQQVLTPEQYNKLFSARKVSLTEARAKRK